MADKISIQAYVCLSDMIECISEASASVDRDELCLYMAEKLLIAADTVLTRLREPVGGLSDKASAVLRHFQDELALQAVEHARDSCVAAQMNYWHAQQFEQAAKIIRDRLDQPLGQQANEEAS